MKPISTERLRMKLQKLWSDLTMIWPTDPIYEPMTLILLREVVQACSIAHMEFAGTVWDCDNFALQLHATVQKYQYNQMKKGAASKIPWAFGECLGTMFRGREEDHAINICITDEGIYLIEPQTNEIWKANKREDNPFFVKF